MSETKGMLSLSLSLSPYVKLIFLESVSLKRLANDNGDGIIVTYPTVDNKEDRQLKRHKKELTAEEAIYQLKLERELRDLQEKIHAKKTALLQQRMGVLMEENAAKDREIAYYINEKNRQPRPQPTPRRAQQPRKPRKQAANRKQPEPVNELAIVPLNQAPVVDAATQARLLEEERVNIELARFDAYIEGTLLSFNEEGINIGIVQNAQVRIAAYIEKFLEATNAPNANRHLRELLEHPFLTTYRVYVMANMPSYPVHNDQAYIQLHLSQKRAVLNTKANEVRYNIMNVNLHAWFLTKAITFLSDDKMKYRPIILSNFAHSYGQDVLNQWYPLCNSGNGFIITADLKIPAVSNLQGQGHGKHCCYCGLQYIACRNGVIKHAHQVKNCDYIANMSNNEYVILTTVLAKTLTCPEFNNHEFIAGRNQLSLLRCATPEEEANGLYVYHGTTNERLRINMPVLLAMRARTYDDFLTRIDVLDTHIKEEMNLNAKPFTYQLDCFGHTAAPAKKKKASTAKSIANASGKTQKEDGFLYKTLMDHQGLQFRKTKFSPDGKKASLRDFVTVDQFGFADSMYYAAPPPLTPQELNAQVDHYIALNMPVPAIQQVEEVTTTVTPLEEVASVLNEWGNVGRDDDPEVTLFFRYRGFTDYGEQVPNYSFNEEHHYSDAEFPSNISF